MKRILKKRCPTCGRPMKRDSAQDGSNKVWKCAYGHTVRRRGIRK